MAKKQEPEARYEYSTTELSRFYGLTIKGMEYYENEGIVKPERVGNSRIRRYNLLDSYRMYMARMLRNSGIGIQEVSNFLNNNTLSNLENHLMPHLKTLQQNLFVQRRILESLEHLEAALKQIREGKIRYEFISREGFYRLFLRRFIGPHKSNREQTLEYQLWNDYLPITAASLCFPKNDCQRIVGEVDTRIGLIIDETDFHAFNFEHSDRTQFIPGGKFLHTIIVGDAEKLCDKTWLAPSLEYIETNNLKQTGDAFTRMLFTCEENGRAVRYDEIWIPVRKNKKGGLQSPPDAEEMTG